jgi:hypothetical protein
MNISESFQQIIPQMMNDTSDNWLFAFNCVVPNLRSSTLSVNDSNQFFHPIVCHVSNFRRKNLLLREADIPE